MKSKLPFAVLNKIGITLFVIGITFGSWIMLIGIVIDAESPDTVEIGLGILGLCLLCALTVVAISTIIDEWRNYK